MQAKNRHVLDLSMRLLVLLARRRFLKEKWSDEAILGGFCRFFLRFGPLDFLFADRFCPSSCLYVAVCVFAAHVSVSLCNAARTCSGDRQVLFGGEENKAARTCCVFLATSLRRRELYVIECVCP